MKKFMLLAAFAVAISIGAIAQSSNYINNEKDFASHPYWIDMMQDPEANFHETVEAFEIYWENREITKGSGYKPFKRWEYYWSSRVNPDGSRRPANETFNAYFEFVNKAKSSRENYFEGDWTNLGPIDKPGNSGTGQPNGNGRINDIEFHPTDPEIIYIGAPAGGLWFTADGGENWVSFTDNLPTLGVSSIAIDYTNTDIVYIGTGDRDAGDAQGMGVMKSYDAGVSFDFVTSGMGNTTVGRLIMHPTKHNTLLAATSGGIYKTSNGGENWSRTRSGNFKEIIFKVDDPDVVFASASGDFYRSTDEGETWEIITDGIGSASRGVIGVSDDDPDVVYFHTVQGSAYAATYLSTDAGLSFIQKANSPNIMSWNCNGGDGGQGWYDLDIAVDPANANILYSGGVNVWKSTNSAASWEINSHWYGGCAVPAAHADCHALEYNPLDGKLYSGNDGGIYWTDNGGQTWNEITSGLAISQIYKIGQAKTNKDKVMNGYQDNGTATYLGEAQGFQTVMGGDGMDCAYDHQDDRYAYGEYYNGAGISRIFNNYNQGSISNNIPESGAWVTPLTLDVEDPKTMYVGMKNIWVTNNTQAGNVQWNKITDLGNSNLSVIEQSEADANIFYAATSSTLIRTDNVKDGAPTWTNLTTYLPASGSLSDIETHPSDPNIVYITLGLRVFRSEDKGVSWDEITLNLPNTSMNTIEYFKRADEGLFVGSDAGIYYKDGEMDEWILFSDGFPLSANVTEIEVYYDGENTSGDLVRASTYGRGLWSSPAFYSEPTAEFSSSETIAPIGCGIDFYDESYGVPHSWEWTFEGGEPSTSTEQNPTDIVYLTEGTYAVSLSVSNPAGSDTKTIDGYITIDAALLPLVNFTASDSLICTSQSVQFFDESQGCPTEYLWAFDPGNVTFLDGTSETSENPVVQFDEAGSYSVTLTVTNVAGSSSETKENYIFAGGYELPFLENFEGASFAEMGWSVENPDAKKTWELATVIGANGDETQASWINNFNYTNLGSRDLLISPILNFQGFESVLMSFEYAYAQRYNQKDSLIVLLSDNCGETWTRVYANGPDGAGIFETSEPTVQFFEPTTNADWCGMGYGADCPIIDLSEWAGKSNIQLAFENYTNYGNNLYIGNVEVSSTVGLFNHLKHGEEDIVIYPNPAKDHLTIILNNPDNYVLSIADLNGKEIMTATMNGSSYQLDTSDLPTGIYVLKVNGNNTSTTKKLIIQ